MFSNLTKNQPIFVIDKSGDGELKIGVVSELRLPNTYQFQPIGTQPTIPFDIVVKYEDGREDTFPQLQPGMSVATFNNGNVVVCDNRDIAQMEIEKIIEYSRKHLEMVPHYEKLLETTEQMLRQLSPSYAKQQQTDEEIRNLKEGMSQMSGTLTEMKGMMEKMIAGISSSKKSNN